MDMPELQRLCLAVLDDCSGPATDNLRRRLRSARSPEDIWMARCEMFQLVAQNRAG